jgi:signal transduction histidine kinase
MKLKALALDLVIGLGAAALALLLRSGLDPFLGNRYPFASGYLFIAITVWYFGWRAAAVMTLLFYPLGNLFFVDPRGTFSLMVRADIVGFTINMISSAILIFLGHKARETTQELTRVNAVLDAANKELSENARRKDEFLAVLSHELRNPLAPILIASSMLERPGLSEIAAAEAVRVLNRQSRQMSGLLDDLLDLSRIAKGRIELKRSSADLTKCVDDAIQSHRALILKKQQTLPGPSGRRGRSQRGRAPVYADRGQHRRQCDPAFAGARRDPGEPHRDEQGNTRVRQGQRPGHRRSAAAAPIRFIPCRASHGATHGRLGNRSFADQEPGRIARRNDTRFQCRRRSRQRIYRQHPDRGR